MRLLSALMLCSALVAAPALAAPSPELAAKIAAMGRRVDPMASAALYGPLQRPVDPAVIKVQRDIAYGEGAKATLDAFAPVAAGKPRPILIFVHGGAFRFDDKSRLPNGAPSPFYDNVMAWAVDHGLVGINMNYALAPGATYPAVQRDIATVVRWARANAAQLGGDPDRIVIWGHSAGASHVAAYLAHPEVYADLADGQAAVKATVLSSGIYEMGGEPDHVYFGPAAGLAERSATAGLVKSKAAILVAGAQFDPPGMVAQADALEAALTAAHHPSRRLVIEGHGHMTEVHAVNTDDASVSTPVLDFLKAQLP